MINEKEKQQHLKDIRRAYILARVVNIQYVWIREFIHPSLLKALNNAKAANSFFIKQIDDAFLDMKKGKDFISNEEEMAFKLLEELEKLDKEERINKLKNVNN